MDLLDNASAALQIIIRSGTILRVGYCFLRMTMSEEETVMYKKRIRNSIVFLIISELVWVLKSLVLAYYG